MTETTFYNRVSKRKRLYDFIIKVNLFDEKETISRVDQLLATRIFASLLAISLTIVIGFTAFTVQTYTRTIQSPSESTFEQLSVRYPSTLSCPCRQSSIRQDQFISFDPQYHPICTSQFVNQTFISTFLSDMNMSDYWPLDYRIMAASHFQIFSLLCRTITQMVSDALKEFATEYIITDRVLSHNTFDAQVIALIEQLKVATIVDIKHTSDFLRFNIFQNKIFSGLRTNYFINSVPGALTNKINPARYTTLNRMCDCSLRINCAHEAGIYNRIGRASISSSTTFGDQTYDPQLVLTIPGMMVGCLPFDVLLQSTLECFYNQSCIHKIQTFINGLSLISPLSLSRFKQNTSVSDLFDQLFIESWNEKSNFTDYYQACSPHTCTYSYNRRFNLLYIVITIISFFGGLKTILFFCAPFIVKIIRRLQKTKYCHNTTDEITTVTEINPNKSLKDRFVSIVRRIYLKLVTCNMFPLSSDIIDGLYSTRLYISLCITGILILLFYTSIPIQSRSITIHQPSQSEYEQLFTKYSSTLVCPCTHLSVSYSSIIHIEPHYHQVCSSDFVKNNAWLLYFNDLSGSFYAFDFRITGSGLFALLQTFCRMSNETVTNKLAAFNDTQFVSARVLTNDIFNTQTSILIQQFQQQTIASFLGLFELIRASIQLNQFVVFGNANAGLTDVLSYDAIPQRFVSRNDYNNNCSCGKSTSCTRPQGFYCRTTYCFAYTARPNQTIPGLVISCLFVDSLLASSLQCFYDASCIQMLIDWHSFGSTTIMMNPRVTSVIPLNSMISSRFFPNTTLDKIVSQLFIEAWTNSTNFSSYYHQCAPDECTYTYEERFNIAYITTTMLAIFGGLSTALHILVLPIVKLLRQIYRRCQRPQEQVEREAIVEIGIRHKVTIFIIKTRNSIRTMNLYRKVQRHQTATESQTTDQIHMIQRQQIATRFYIILFLFSILVILLFTGLNSQIHLNIVSFPNESIFEALQTQYSSRLSCPCSQIAIQYSKFLSVQPSTYHQVCSSDFISSDFINLLWGSDKEQEYFWNIDLKILSTQFRSLALICSLTQNAIEQKIAIFSSRDFLSIETLTRHSFETQVNSIIDSFIIQTPVSFRQTHKYIMEIFHANQLHTIFNTNWNITQSTPKDSHIMSTHPIWYNESSESCSCATSSTCSKSLLVSYNKTEKLPGLVLGCLPISGLRLSTLECLYNLTCLNRLISFIGSSSVPSPLDITVYTRFTPVSSITIGTLIDELFIETWQNSSNYSNYFETCAPLTCQYTHVERNSVLLMLTTFLGLYGGLAAGLQFFVWYALCIYWKVRRWFAGRPRQIQPEN